MDGVDIATADKSLASRILALQKAAYLSEAEIYADDRIPPLVQTLASVESDFDTHTFYVATAGSSLIGSVNIRIDGGVGHIGRLVVLPTAQNRGIGSRLMSYVEGRYSGLECFELFTGHKSQHNLEFYRKRGYIEYKRDRLHAGLTLVYMRKSLVGSA